MTAAALALLEGPGLPRLLMALRNFAPPSQREAPDLHVVSASEIDRLRNRRADAWNEFFVREMPAIYRYALSRLVSAADAEDATSHTFEEAWEHAERLEDEGLPARAWLFGIARNVVNTYRRRRLRRPPPVALEAFDGGAADPSLEPELLDLARALSALEGGQAEVISLRFVHGLSLEETAAVLETTVDGVKGRQARALATLREKLDARG